ncbi:GNAT family N-acetyltransferase [Arthrobacter sp. Hz1]
MGGVGGPAGPPPPPPATELYMVYVLAEAYGSGLGRLLVHAAIGTSSSFVWVLETNARATAFYRKLGFEPDGARERLSTGWNDQTEIRMVRGGSS